MFPCKDCGDRRINCHASCERYLAAKSEHDALREKNRIEQEFDVYNYLATQRVCKKCKIRKSKKGRKENP